MEDMTMTTETTCSYCGGAGGNAENLEHNAQCPRFGSRCEINAEGLNALRDGTRGPVAPPVPRDHRQEWIDEDRRIRARLAATQEG